MAENQTVSQLTEEKIKQSARKHQEAYELFVEGISSKTTIFLEEMKQRIAALEPLVPKVASLEQENQNLKKAKEGQEQEIQNLKKANAALESEVKQHGEKFRSMSKICGN